MRWLTRCSDVESMWFAYIDELFFIFCYTWPNNTKVVLEMTPRSMSINKGTLQGIIPLLRTSLFPIVSSVSIDDSKVLLIFGEENSSKNLLSGLCWVFLLIISPLLERFYQSFFEAISAPFASDESFA